MGAFATTHVVRDLQATMMTDHGVRLNKIVMWGVAPYVSAMKDLSSSTKTTTTPQPPICVAVIQGQDDAIIDWMHDTLGKGLSDQFWAKLPSTAREFTLPSGTHSGFAHYDPSMFPENNTDRLRQQIRTVQLTHEFITGSSPP